MSIRLTCPNGHALKVDESMAGRVGLCPACKARVQIPKIQPSAVSEEDILSLLADPPEQNIQPAAGTAGSAVSANQAAKSAAGAATGPAKFTPPPVPMPTKRCIKCHAEIAVVMHICPHCHTYVAKVSDVLRGR